MAFNTSDEISKFKAAYQDITTMEQELGRTILQASNGQRFVIDTQTVNRQETGQTPDAFLKFLTERSKETKTFTLEQVKQRLRL